MDNNNFIETKYIFLLITVLIMIAVIPIYFYINSEINNKLIKNRLELSAYAQKVANKIYKFSNSNKREFYFPRSNIFKSAIYDKKGEVIFSLLEKHMKIFPANILESDGNIYFKYRLKDNVFNASAIIVSKKNNYKKIIINVLTVLLIIVFLVFLTTFFIIKQSTKPYKKINEYLENFIKDAMHEMKTPMGVILLNLDVLDITYEKNKTIKRAKSALKNMIVVYEDLEFFVRKNEIERPKTDVNLSNFCEERIEFFMDLLNSKEIKVKKNIEKNIHVNFSVLELSRIIDNTISNAIKFSKNDTNIYLSLYKFEDSFILEIKDEGKGIEDIDKIFDRYYRGDKISGGFGIGLSIVKNICDANNVDIKIISKIDKGSTFIFTFKSYNELSKIT